MTHQPPTSDTPDGATGFIDGFLPRMTANVVAMAGVALVTWWMVDDQMQGQQAALEEVRAEAELLRHERDRMRALSEELAREVHDAGMEAEIAHWQLRWTEERLRRLEVEASGVDAPPPRFGRVRIEALDAPAAAFLDARVDALVVSSARSADDARSDGSGAEPDMERGSTPLGIEAVPFDPRIPSILPATGQRDRDRALATWKRILEETVEAECGGRFSQAGRWRCEDDRRRQLWPYTNVAVDCVLSGNAVPDYVSDLPLSDLPSHSVPLDKGALILCDGALVNP